MCAGPREVQASVSPTPSVVDPGVISTDCIAILRSAILRLMSPGDRSRRLSRSRALRVEENYFFFFAAGFRFAGAFFFAAVFAFAFFTIVPS